MKRVLSLSILAALCVSAAACDIERPGALRNTGLGDRCADYLRLSYPDGKIDVKLQHTQVATTESGKIGLMIVDVSGDRRDIPATGGFLTHEVAARCRFENGILTQFRWTKGPYK